MNINSVVANNILIGVKTPRILHIIRNIYSIPCHTVFGKCSVEGEVSGSKLPKIFALFLE